jgi:hypothetical protein
VDWLRRVGWQCWQIGTQNYAETSSRQILSHLTSRRTLTSRQFSTIATLPMGSFLYHLMQQQVCLLLHTTPSPFAELVLKVRIMAFI